MASLTQWTWIWASSRRLWKTGKPGVLQSMGSQRVRLDLGTEQQQTLRHWVWDFQFFSALILCYFTGARLCGNEMSDEDVFYSHVTRSQPLSEHVPLGCGLHKWPYFFFCSLGETERPEGPGVGISLPNTG